MERASAWMRIGDGSLAAAGAMLRGQPELHRSAVSRAYYAMFAAVTGVLILSGQRPRSRFGTWSHADLPDAARETLRSRVGLGRARDVKSRLEVGYKLRVAADYETGLTIDDEAARRAVSNASAVVRLVREVTR